MYLTHTTTMSNESQLIDMTVPHDWESMIKPANLKPNPKGGSVIYATLEVNGDPKTPFSLEMPPLFTWGAEECKDQSGNPTGKYAQTVQFPTKAEATPESRQCLKNFEEIERVFKKHMIKTSTTWNGAQLNDDSVGLVYNKMLKRTKIKGSKQDDMTKEPTINFKLQINDKTKQWEVEIYDEECNLVFPDPTNRHVTPLDFLKKMSTCKNCVTFAGVWVVNGKFSITWKLEQSIVKNPRQKMIGAGKCLMRITNADKKTLQSSTVDEPEQEPEDEGVSSTVVDDSDTDQPAPEIQPTKVHKKSKKSVPEPVPEPEPEDEDSAPPVVVVMKEKKSRKPKAA